jgi:hypothetical protein
MATQERHVSRRELHESKWRELTVSRVARVTPLITQVELTGESLGGDFFQELPSL